MNGNFLFTGTKYPQLRSLCRTASLFKAAQGLRSCVRDLRSVDNKFFPETTTNSGLSTKCGYLSQCCPEAPSGLSAATRCVKGNRTDARNLHSAGLGADKPGCGTSHTPENYWRQGTEPWLCLPTPLTDPKLLYHWDQRSAFPNGTSSQESRLGAQRISHSNHSRVSFCFVPPEF